MDELGLVHAGLSAVDDIIAKAIGLSEVAQMGRIEVRQRQLLTAQWDKLASKAEKNAIGVLVGGSGAVRDGEIGRMLGAIDKQMGQWAFKVQDSFNDDMERVYNLAREAGFKKATKQTTASLQYDTKPFTAEVKKATPRVAEILPSFDIIDESAVAALKRNNTFWIGAHYNQNVRQGISEATSDVIIEQGRRRADAIIALKDKLGPELRRIRIPSGWVGTDKQYFEALTANAATVGRVQGQLVSFTQAGVTRYVIVNPTDERTCPVCGHMDGKVFSVQWATTHMENVLQASNPDEVRNAHPWLSVKQMREISPTSGKSTVADSRKLTQAGFGQPPFHFRCRCTVDVSEEAGSFEPLAGDELKPVKVPQLKVPKRPKATGPGKPPKQPKVPPKPKLPTRLASKSAWLKSLSDEEQKAFKSWSVGGYSQMRHFDAGLATEEWLASTKISWHINATTNREAVEDLRILRAALAHSPERRGKVYRGISRLSPEQAEAIAKKGHTIDQLAISSWSKKSNVADQFAIDSNMSSLRERFITMSVKPKSRAFDVADWSITQPNEAEVMLEKGKKFKIMSVRKKTIRVEGIPFQGFHITLEEI